MYIYVDNAATTPMSTRAKEAFVSCMDKCYGNPSSLHTIGQEAAVAMLKAREKIASCLDVHPKEIYFTSGGSEADNQAIMSAAQIGKRQGKKHIISTTFEHHAVLHTLQKLEKEGFLVTYLDVHENGIVSAKQVKEAIREDTILVTIMYVNNEIGTIQPIKEIGQVCHDHKILFHTDAVQAVGHIPVDIKENNIDLLSLSAHKFHGPKGIGVLYARTGILLSNIIEGGAQERGKRAGTENVPAICAMAEALEEACENMDENAKHLSEMRDYLIKGLSSIEHAKLNGDLDSRVPGTVNFCFEGIEGESLLLLLNARKIGGSSGSACTSGSLDPSHVLLAIGLPHEVAHGSLRLSLSHYNTMEEMEYLVKNIKEVVQYLRSISPVWEDLQNGTKPHLI